MNKLKTSIIVVALSLSFIVSTFSQPKLNANETVQIITNLQNKCVNHDCMLYDLIFNGKPYLNNNVLFNENTSKKGDQYFKGEFGLNPRSELSKKLSSRCFLCLCFHQ